MANSGVISLAVCIWCRMYAAVSSAVLYGEEAAFPVPGIIVTVVTGEVARPADNYGVRRILRGVTRCQIPAWLEGVPLTIVREKNH